MRAIGVILRIAYRLRSHYWFGLPLARWLALLMIVAVVGALIRWRSSLWPVMILAALFLIYAVVLIWAGRQGYTRFVTSPNGDSSSRAVDSSSPLASQETVPMRVTGWFEVEGEKRYHVDLEADFETAGTREHIVMGRVRPSRFLLVGQWPKRDLGWWYIFFQPGMIREMQRGNLYHGLRSRPAISLAYTPDGQAQQTIYLAFSNMETLQRIWDDLRLDAPSSAVT